MSIPQNSAFGRKVRVTIYTNEGHAQVFESNLAKDKRGLKITGTVKKYFAIQPPEATISIYNLSPVEVGNILNQKYKKVGDDYVEQQLRIKVEAGYEYGLFGTIFDGEILKPNMLKPDPNNTQLRLTCIDGANFVSAGGSITQTFNDGVNYYAIAAYIKNNSNVDFRLELSPTLAQRTVDGSFVSGSTLQETYKSISENTDMVFSYRDQTATIATMNEILTQPQEVFTLNSRTGLMGIPALTNDGVTVQSVLNPRLDVLRRLKINNAEISVDQPEYLANRQVGAWLDSDGLYIITEVQHEFDTTTGNFCTNCKCFASNYYTYLT